MKKVLLIVVLAIGILVALFFALNAYIYSEKQGDGLPQDFKEVTFTISGEPVSLKDGVAQARTNLGGDALTTITYFGNEIAHDVDGDGIEDMVFLITQETKAGNEYFYLAAALKRDDGYVGSQAVLIGDRIKPQSTDKGEGRSVIVNYVEAARPETGRSLHLLLDVDTLEFGELVQDFEGESR
ncbi:MAG: hypothetical protein V4682_01725 [Patescibacteria group bacterium]